MRVFIAIVLLLLTGCAEYSHQSIGQVLTPQGFNYTYYNQGGARPVHAFGLSWNLK